MGYPYNPKRQQTIQTDAPGMSVDRGFVAHLVVPASAAVAASATGVHAAVTLADGETTTVTTEITSPATPRGLTITGNAATATGDVVITGTSITGKVITETIVSTGAATVEGAKAFKTITSIVLPARGAEGDTISVGWGNKLGLPYLLYRNSFVSVFLGNARESTLGTVTVHATNHESNTIKLASALNGSQVHAYLIV